MLHLHDLSKHAHYSDRNDVDTDSVGDDDNENDNDNDNDDEEDDNDGGITELPLNPVSLNKSFKTLVTKVCTIVKMFRNSPVKNDILATCCKELNGGIGRVYGTKKEGSFFFFVTNRSA